MSDENVGMLLHKLTKYQTLLGGNGTSEKSSVYRQKINQYEYKLKNLGLSEDNLRQMGGMIGGDKFSDTLKGLIADQSNRIKNKISELNSGVPQDTSGLNQKVDEVSTLITIATGKYSDTIKNLVELIRTLLGELVKLEQIISTLGTPAGVDLTVITTSIENIKNQLATLGTDDQILSTYKELLLKDISDNENKFVDTTGKHTDLLSVELRQLAQLMGLKGDEQDFDSQLESVFNNASPQVKTAVTKLLDGSNSDGVTFAKKYVQ